MGVNYKRLGPLSKCPACGWQIDAEAYRCPKCRIYFCFKCRKRVSERSAQYQCVNQTCSCHGKLLCSNCVTVQLITKEIQRHVGGDAVFIAAIVVGLTLMFGSCSISVPLFGGHGGASVLIGVIVGIGAFVAGCMLVSKIASFLDRKYNTSLHSKIHQETEVTGEHRCCIECNQPAERLH